MSALSLYLSLSFSLALALTPDASLIQQRHLILSLRDIFQVRRVSLLHYDALDNGLKVSLEAVELLKVLGRRKVYVSSRNLATLDLDQLDLVLAGRPMNVVALRGDEGHVITALQKISRRRSLSPAIWVLLMDEGDAFSKSLLSGLVIPLDCHFVVVHGGTRADKVILVGDTSVESLTLDELKKILAYPKKNLHGLTIKAGIAHYPPGSAVEETKEGRVTAGGFSGALWKALEAPLNFTSEFIVPEDKTFGGMTPSGRWLGLIGDLQRNRVDVGIICIYMSALRWDALDFLMTIHYTRMNTFLKEPDTRATSWESVTRPFSVALWCCFVATVALLGSSLQLSERRHQRLEEEGDGKVLLGVPDLWFHALGSVFCLQGFHRTPRSVSSRLVVASLFLLGIVVLAAYSAALFSYLVLDVPLLPFNSLEEMLINPQGYTLGMPSLLQINSTPGLSRDLWEAGIIEPDPAKNPRELSAAIPRICRDKFAYNVGMFGADAIRRSAPCSIVVLPQTFGGEFFSAFATVKNSPFRGTINEMIIRLRTAGILEAERLRYEGPRSSATTRPSPSTLQFHAVTMYNVAPVFAILAVFVIAAMIFLLGEVLKGKVRKVRY